MSGADSGNYVLSNPTETTTANVAAVALTGSVTASDKPYDGTTTATLSNLSLVGVLGSEQVTLSPGTTLFDTKNVGTGKTVTASGLALGGADKGNYTLSNQIETTTASITPELVLNGTAGVDDLRLMRSSSPFVDWFIFNGGNPTSFGQLAAAGDAAGLTINGLGGNDTILLDQTNGNPLPGMLHLNGTFTINGLDSSNTLALARQHRAG